MNLVKPNEQFTIYTKNECKNCWIIKRVLEIEKHTFETIECDKYLIEHKEEFINVMRMMMNIRKDQRIYFPIVFYNGMYLEDPLEFMAGISNDDDTFF